jgi:hypothetical protein
LFVGYKYKTKDLNCKNIFTFIFSFSIFIGVVGNKKAPPKGRANLKQTNIPS